MCLLCSCVWWLVSFMWSITYVWGLWPSTGACLNLSSANMSLRRGWNRYVLSAGLLVASILVNGNYYLLQNVWCVFTRADWINFELAAVWNTLVLWTNRQVNPSSIESMLQHCANAMYSILPMLHIYQTKTWSFCLNIANDIKKTWTTKKSNS